MKRVKITLPNGGTKTFSLNHQGLNGEFYPVSPHTVTYEADEIIIEGDVLLTQLPAARIPFDLEAAKAGAKVLRNGTAGRWLGLSDHNEKAKNIVEDEFGLWYAEDHELSMAPNPRRTVWVNLYKNQSSCYYESPEESRRMALPSAIASAVPIVI